MSKPEHEGGISEVGQQPAFADEIGASDCKAAEMTVSEGKLVIGIARSPRRKRRYKLDKLAAGITPDNRHEEVDWAPPSGNEAWPASYAVTSAEPHRSQSIALRYRVTSK